MTRALHQKVKDTLFGVAVSLAGAALSPPSSHTATYTYVSLVLKLSRHTCLKSVRTARSHLQILVRSLGPSPTTTS